MNDATKIVDTIGRAEIAGALGVTVDAVSVNLKRGGLPPAWFAVVRDLCKEAGTDCPESAFNWKSPASAPSEEAS